MKIFSAEAIFKYDLDNTVTLTVPSGKIDVITKFELENGETIDVTIDMEADWVAISNSNNLRPVLKASIDETEPPETSED